MTRRRPVLGSVVLAAVTAGFEFFAVAVPARADSGPSLGGWNISADANVVDVLFDNATGLAGIHPFTEADFPEAESQFATGPFGSGLATVFWPGSAGGNFGSLSSQLGFPSQLEPLASQMNDPIKAGAQYPAGPAKATYPAGAPGGLAHMQSTAGPGGTSSSAAVADIGQAGVLSFSSARGTSSSVADSTARGTATSDLSGVSLLGGLIEIGSIQSTATAQSDGNHGSGSASTRIAGIKVLGQPASIGSDGLVLPDFAKALGPLTGPLVQSAIAQTISGLGLRMTEFPSLHKEKAGSYTATSGGLSVLITPPPSAAPLLEQAAAQLAPLFPSQAAIVPTLPGILQGATLTLTLGRATASAAASPPFSDSFNPAGAGAFGGTAGGGSGGPGGTGAGSAPTLAGSAGSGPAGAGATASPAPAGSGPGPSLSAAGPGARPGGATPGGLPATLVSLSSPLGAGIVLLGLLVACGLGYALWRLARLLLPQEAGPACPLGRDDP